MSTSNDVQSGQSGQGNTGNDTVEHQEHRRASQRAAQMPHNDTDLPGESDLGGIAQEPADATALQAESRVSVDALSTDREPEAQQGLGFDGSGDMDDATTVVGNESISDSSSVSASQVRINLPIRNRRRSADSEWERTLDIIFASSSDSSSEPAEGHSLPPEHDESPGSPLDPRNIDWDSVFDLSMPRAQEQDASSQQASPEVTQHDPVEESTTLVDTESISEASTGYATESAPEEWSDDEDEAEDNEQEEEEDVDVDWERDPRVIPAAGVPVSDPVISQIQFVFDTTHWDIDMRERESLDIRYAPGPWLLVTHASPREPWRRATNFMFRSPRHPQGVVAVVSISTEGLRTAIQAMRHVMWLRFGVLVRPLGSRARQRAAAWDGHWTYHCGRQGAIRNGSIEVTGYWGWEDPWSPVGARSILEMMQDAARLHGSWRVLVFARPPADNSSMWPLPGIGVMPMQDRG